MCGETTYYLKYNSPKKQWCSWKAFLQVPAPGIAPQPGAGKGTPALLIASYDYAGLTACVTVCIWFPEQNSVTLHMLRT